MKLSLAVLAAGCVSLAGCGTTTAPPPTPVMPAAPAALRSPAGEEAAGRLFARDGLVASDALLRYVNLVGSAVSAGRPAPSVGVTDSDLLYSASFPGGIVVISRGALALMGTEAEVAVVIGREICRFDLAGRGTAEGPDAASEERFDACGVRLAAAAGYDPSAFGRYLELLRERAASAREKADVDRRLHALGALPEIRGGGKLLADRFRRRVIL